jgi:uncharacterized membrane protein
MDDSFKEAIETAGKAIDVLGVGTIVAGVVLATVHLGMRRRGAEGALRRYRQDIGRAILLGLEFLVAADIVRTVAVSPTFTSAGVLAMIVLIRTFLSFTLELELSGRWPWQSRPSGNVA